MDTGTPVYYLATAALKEPVGFVFAFAAALLGALAVTVWPFSPRARRVVPFAAFSIMMLTTASLTPGYQDYRYVLPALACLPATLGFILLHLPRVSRAVLYGATVLGALEGVMAWPNYTAFVNLAAHWAAQDGHRLVDPKTVYRSQDLLRLSKWLSEHPQTAANIRLDVVAGSAPLRLYGLPDRQSPPSPRRAVSSLGSPPPVATDPSPGWYAVEKYLVMDGGPDALTSVGSPDARDFYRQLQRNRPVARIGATILVYYFSEDVSRSQ